MITIIGADAARMAGLQIDHSIKLKSGQLSMDHWERFLNLSPEARENRFGDDKKSRLAAEVLESVEKFGLLVDLDIIVVPADYDHATALASFKKRHQGGKTKSFAYYNGDSNDANFPNPSRILKPGDRLWARVFQQVVSGTTTSEERMKFLATQKAIHTGAQGLSLVFDQKRDRLPKGKWYSSFDEKKMLWQDSDRDHRVPSVDAYSDGDFVWSLGYFEDPWDDYNAFVCLCDLPAGEADKLSEA